MSKIIPGEIVFRGLVGSHAHGTNIEGSDRDYKGVYIQTPESVLSRGYVPQVQINKDEVYYELGRFVELCSKANPTMLELLYLPEECILEEKDAFKRLRLLRNRFLTKACANSFGGYARAQIKKAEGLNKKMNWDPRWAIKKSPLDFCYILNEFLECSVPFTQYLSMQSKYHAQQHTNYALRKLDHMRDTFLVYYDADDEYSNGVFKEGANQVCINKDIPKSANANAVFHFNSTAYSEHCAKHKSYKQWIKERNEQRYVDVKNHGQKIDGKNMLHCIRLIEMAKEISEGKILQVRRPNTKYLKSIRKGEVDLKTLLTKSEHDLKIMTRNFENSDLPQSVHKESMVRLVSIIRNRHYRIQNKKLARRNAE